MIRRNLFAAASALLLAFVLHGCFKMHQATTLFADGSGKLVVELALKKSMLAFGGGMGGEEDPFAEFSDPLALDEMWEGISAWSTPEIEEDGKWKRVRMTGWFEDINAVRRLAQDDDEESFEEFGEGGEESADGDDAEAPDMSFTLTENDGLYELVLVDKDTMKLGEMTGGPDADEEGGEGDEDGAADDMAAGMMAMMKEMMEGFEIRPSFVVPGKIESVQGFTSSEGRNAEMAISHEDMFPEDAESKEQAAARERLMSAEQRKITWRGNDVSADELAAFKRELAEAKASWGTRLAAARAALEKSARDSGDEESE